MLVSDSNRDGRGACEAHLGTSYIGSSIGFVHFFPEFVVPFHSHNVMFSRNNAPTIVPGC